MQTASDLFFSWCGSQFGWVNPPPQSLRELSPIRESQPAQTTMQGIDQNRQIGLARIAGANEYRERAQFDACLDDRTEIAYIETVVALTQLINILIVHRYSQGLQR